jgi:cyclase
MLTKRIIPCLDVTQGRVVKGTSFTQLRDAGDPVEQGAFYYSEGADELVFLDIGATPEGRDTMADVVRRVSEQVFIPLTVGGGIRTIEDMRRMLEAGADKTSINTAAVFEPGLITEGAKRFGSQCVVVAIDARRVEGPSSQKWVVCTHGGRRPTEIDAVAWAKEAVDRGSGEILLTSWDEDGQRSLLVVGLARLTTSSMRLKRVGPMQSWPPASSTTGPTPSER